MSLPLGALSRSDRTALRRRGCVVIPDVLTSGQVFSLRRKVAAAAESAMTDGRQDCVRRVDVVGHASFHPGLDLVSDWIHGFARSPRWSKASETMLQMATICIHVKYLHRIVSSSGFYKWKQERGTNIDHFDELAISFFIPLCRSRERRAIHRHGMHDPRKLVAHDSRGDPISPPDGARLKGRPALVRPGLKMSAGSVMLQTCTVMSVPLRHGAHARVLQINYRQSPFRQAARDRFHRGCAHV